MNYAILFREILDRIEAHVETYPDTLLVAIDVPSGMNSNTGAVANGTMAMDITVTFGAPKIGMLLYPARSYCGNIAVKGLGFSWEMALLDDENKNYPSRIDYTKFSSRFITGTGRNRS